MSTPDRRARDKDRDAAIEIVEAAWSEGQIVDADRDHRVEALLRAETLAEIQMLTHDLQLPGSPVAVATESPYGEPPVVTSGAPDYATPQQVTTKSGRRSGGVALIVLVVVIAVVGGVIAGLVAVVQGVDSTLEAVASSEAPLPGEPAEEGVNTLSRDGYAELLDDLETVVGSTEAFEAVLYPGYAVVSLPVDGTSQRESRWYWNGELDDLDSRGTASYQRFDLTEVDMDVVIRLVKRVRGMVEEPTSFYAILRAPDEPGGQAISVYASNEYSESGYLLATAEGKVLYNSAKP